MCFLSCRLKVARFHDKIYMPENLVEYTGYFQAVTEKLEKWGQGSMKVLLHDDLCRESAWTQE